MCTSSDFNIGVVYKYVYLMRSAACLGLFYETREGRNIDNSKYSVVNKSLFIMFSFTFLHLFHNDYSF